MCVGGDKLLKAKWSSHAKVLPLCSVKHCAFLCPPCRVSAFKFSNRRRYVKARCKLWEVCWATLQRLNPQCLWPFPLTAAWRWCPSKFQFTTTIVPQESRHFFKFCNFFTTMVMGKERSSCFTWPASTSRRLRSAFLSRNTRRSKCVMFKFLQPLDSKCAKSFWDSARIITNKQKEQMPYKVFSLSIWSMKWHEYIHLYLNLEVQVLYCNRISCCIGIQGRSGRREGGTIFGQILCTPPIVRSGEKNSHKLYPSRSRKMIIFWSSCWWYLGRNPQ